MPLWLFIFLAALSIIAALGVILQRHPIHSLLALVMTLVVVAILFIGLGATTVGFLQVIVYAGRDNGALSVRDLAAQPPNPAA